MARPKPLLRRFRKWQQMQGFKTTPLFLKTPPTLKRQRAKKHATKLIFRGAPDYPLSFDDLTDAPPFLWALGELALLQRPKIALVGARMLLHWGLG